MCVCVCVYVHVYVLITVISYEILRSNGNEIYCKTRCGRGYLVPNRGHTALYWAEMRLRPYALSIHYIQKHPTMEEEFVAHDPSIGYVTK